MRVTTASRTVNPVSVVVLLATLVACTVNPPASKAEAGAGATAAPTYTAQRLPVLRRYPSGYPTGINDQGVVVGSALSAKGGRTRAVQWRDGRIRALTSPPGSRNARADAVNDTGLVVGSARRLAGDRDHAVVWRNGRPRWLPEPPGTVSSGALDVNEDGLIVGFVQTAQGDRSVVWRDGDQELGPSGTASAVNDGSVVAGSSYTLDTLPTPYRWPVGEAATTLLALTSGLDSVARDLNNSDIVVGLGLADRSGRALPLMWTGARPEVLPLLKGFDSGAAEGINDDTTVVGRQYTSTNTEAAVPVVWLDGSVRQLPGVAPSDGSGLDWYSADDVNSAGVVVGARQTVNGMEPLIWQP